LKPDFKKLPESTPSTVFDLFSIMKLVLDVLDKLATNISADVIIEDRSGSKAHL